MPVLAKAFSSRRGCHVFPAEPLDTTFSGVDGERVISAFTLSVGAWAARADRVVAVVRVETAVRFVLPLVVLEVFCVAVFVPARAQTADVPGLRPVVNSAAANFSQLRLQQRNTGVSVGASHWVQRCCVLLEIPSVPVKTRCFTAAFACFAARGCVERAAERATVADSVHQQKRAQRQETDKSNHGAAAKIPAFCAAVETAQNTFNVVLRVVFFLSEWLYCTVNTFGLVRCRRLRTDLKTADLTQIKLFFN